MEQDFDLILLHGLYEPEYSIIEFWQKKQTESGFSLMVFWQKLCDSWQKFCDLIENKIAWVKISR